MEVLSAEQKAHDLSVAYVVYRLSKDGGIATPEDFVQEYTLVYDFILHAVKLNC